MSANRAASIRARLKRHADAAKEDFNLVLTRYGLERLLYRLSMSPHANSFVLKGALLFQIWYGESHRPTRDADLLGFGPSDVAALVEVFRSIATIEVDDGIAFDPASVRATEIREGASYAGVRVELRARLDAARIALQVDIGFGDAVTPSAESVEYPTFIDDVPAPVLRAYPKASVIAEKLHAACVLGLANSRMKDYFDLWMLLRDPALRDEELAQAVQNTFIRRQTALPTATPIGLSEAFARDAGKLTQWHAFLKRNQLEAIELPDVVAAIRSRLHRIGLAKW